MFLVTRARATRVVITRREIRVLVLSTCNPLVQFRAHRLWLSILGSPTVSYFDHVSCRFSIARACQQALVKQPRDKNTCFESRSRELLVNRVITLLVDVEFVNHSTSLTPSYFVRSKG